MLARQITEGIDTADLKDAKDLPGCMFNPAYHGGYIYRRYQKRNKRMEDYIDG